MITDVGSTKGPLMRGLTPDEQARCIGGHPLCGSETAGVANARASLYEGATYFLTPGAHVDAAAYQRLYDFLADIGARPVAVDARGARPPHGGGEPPAARAGQRADDAGGPARRARATRCSRPAQAFRDLTRIAGSNRRVWTDIFLENRAALLAALATFQEGLQEVLEALAANDAARLGETIARAAEQRERMLAAGSLPAQRALPPHRARLRPAGRASRRSWSRWATPASTSRTSRCIT